MFTPSNPIAILPQHYPHFANRVRDALYELLGITAQNLDLAQGKQMQKIVFFSSPTSTKINPQFLIQSPSPPIATFLAQDGSGQGAALIAALAQ